MALKIRLPILVRREHTAEPMISDVSTATGTNTTSAIFWGYFRLFKFSSALDAEPGFRMVVYRLRAENEWAQLASQANALPPMKLKNVIPSGLGSILV